MSVKYFCDVCGKEFDSCQGRKRRSIAVLMTIDDEEQSIGFYTSDTCDDCQTKITERFETFADELDSECVHTED